MSQPYDTSASVPECECRPNQTLGHVDTRTNTVYCTRCDGFIANLDDMGITLNNDELMEILRA